MILKVHCSLTLRVVCIAVSIKSVFKLSMNSLKKKKIETAPCNFSMSNFSKSSSDWAAC